MAGSPHRSIVNLRSDLDKETLKKVDFAQAWIVEILKSMRFGEDGSQKWTLQFGQPTAMV